MTQDRMMACPKVHMMTHIQKKIILNGPNTTATSVINVFCLAILCMWIFEISTKINPFFSHAKQSINTTLIHEYKKETA